MKGSRLHLDLFKVFYDLAQTKNFSKTAAQNYLTQSAVSQQMTFLERRLGKRLIERGRGKFALTEAGEAFLEACQKILEAYQEAVHKIQSPGEMAGTVRIETIYSIGLYELASHTKTFMQQYPQVDLHIEYRRSDRIHTDILHNACDLGVVAYPSQNPLILATPFKKEKLVVVCSPEDPLASHKRIRFADLQKKNFIAFDMVVPTRRAIDKILNRRRVFVNIVHEFDNIETIKRSVEVGAGVSILPENTVVQEVGSRALVSIPFSEGTFYRPLAIIRRRARRLSRTAQEFVRWLTK